MNPVLTLYEPDTPGACSIPTKIDRRSNISVGVHKPRSAHPFRSALVEHSQLPSENMPFVVEASMPLATCMSRHSIPSTLVPLGIDRSVVILHCNVSILFYSIFGFISIDKNK